VAWYFGNGRHRTVSTAVGTGSGPPILKVLLAVKESHRAQGVSRSQGVRPLEAMWYFVILALSLGLAYETYETFRLRRAVEKLGNTVEALRTENEDLRKRLEGMRLLVEELSKSAGLSHSPETVAGFSSESVEDPELRRRVLELKVVNLYKQGVSVKEIVKQTGLSRATVYRILKKYRAA